MLGLQKVARASQTEDQVSIDQVYQVSPTRESKDMFLGEIFQGPEVSSVCNMDNEPGTEHSLQKTSKDGIITLKTWRHHGLSATFGFAYRTNGYNYSDGSTYRHRDFASRIEMLRLCDTYLSFKNGKLRQLVVQCTDDVYEAQGVTTWYRTYVRKPSPYFVRLAMWTLDCAHDWNSWMNLYAQLLRLFPAALATIPVVGRFASLVHRRHWTDW